MLLRIVVLVKIVMLLRIVKLASRLKYIVLASF